jgi:peptidoglycan/xylan/chitin deacetylase (PgdA/CDA1 family)
MCLAMSRLLFALLASAPLAIGAPVSPPPATPIPVRPAEPVEHEVPVRASAPKITYSQCHVDGPYIALTFDDGPHGTNTPRLLDLLKQRKVKATFFVVGQCVAEYPDIAKRIVAEGHEIANHSWSHPQLTKLGETSVTEQLGKTHDVIQQTTGVATKILRPPYGAFTQNQQAWAYRKWGYKCILWDVDTLDWKVRNAAHVQSYILGHTVPGSIILMHDIHKTTIDAMPASIDGLLAKGFKFVTVSELLAMDRPPVPKPRATPAPKPEPAVTTAEPLTLPPATSARSN